MSLDDKSSTFTYHGVINSEGVTANTSTGRVSYMPIISKVNGIPNSLLFRVKFIFLTEMIVSQVGAPFSEASSAALLLLSGGTCFTSSSLSLDWHLSVCGYSGAVLLLLVIKIIIIIIIT